MMIFSLCAAALTGCNRSGDEDNTESQENPSDTGDTADNSDLENAVAQALGDDVGNDNQNPQDTAAPGGVVETPVQLPIAEKSPVAITRIEPEPPPTSVSPSATGSDGFFDTADDEEKKPADKLFPIDECEIEVNGIYKPALARDLLKEINSRRLEYGIGPLVQNTSLLACADGRCKEQAYFIGHFRPDGRPFSSISPNGEVKGECIAIEYRTVNEIMEAWFSVNKSRMQIMHPDYTQCGISIYDIDGIYYIAAEFSY